MDKPISCVDRFTQWSEAVYIKDITAVIVTCAFIERRATNLGCPSAITADPGHQIESRLFLCLTTLL